MGGKQHLMVYAWDATDKRYLRSSEFKATVDHTEGHHRYSHIAFWNLPMGDHYVCLVEKPDGYILDKWESRAGGRWVEVDVHRPERRETWVTTHSGGAGFLQATLRKVDIQELLRERKAIVDKITQSLGLTYDEMSAIELIHLCGDRWPDSSIHIWDGKYRFPTHKQIVKVIEYDWVDTKSYKKTWYDCDDFALCFKGHLSENWGINGVGLAEGRLWKGDKFAGIHAYNYLLTHSEEGVEILLFEPQNDVMTEGDTIGELRYEPYLIMW